MKTQTDKQERQVWRSGKAYPVAPDYQTPAEKAATDSRTVARFTDETLKHSYDIETVIDSQIAFITVDANTRSQAASFAKKNGYVVRSVNMIA